MAYVRAVDKCFGLPENLDVARLVGMYAYLALQEGSMGRLFNELMGINRPR
jgi:hypothetical protein